MVNAAQYQVQAPDFGGARNYVMLPDITYTWRVRTATTGDTPGTNEWTAWSARTFHTPTKSSATISRVSPDNGAAAGSTRPALLWDNSDKEVFYYEVQVSSDPGFCNTAGCPMLYWELVHGGVSSPPNTYLVPEQFPLESGAAYHWRVRPRIQGDGEPVDWSESWTFDTP